MAISRADPLLDGELVMLVEPLEVPVVPASWLALHDFKDCRLLIVLASTGTEDVLATVMPMLSTHDAPPLPHDLTCSVCPPGAIETDVLSTVPFSVIALVLLSTEYPIAETAWPEQLEEEAESLNGEVTVAPSAGELTLGLPDGVPLTFTDTSVTQTVPDLPQAFTWIVCPPVPAETDCLRLVPLSVAASAPLSTEYPIDTTDWLEQLDALAVNVNGEATVLSL